MFMNSKSFASNSVAIQRKLQDKKNFLKIFLCAVKDCITVIYNSCK